MIKVILRQDVSGLGRAGEVKQVKEGFARNFLFPKNLVLVATDPNLRQIELAQKKAQAALALEKKRAQEMAQRLKNVSLTLSAEVNEDGKLYGSLTAADIAQAISQDTGLEIGKKSVVLETPIKELGIYELDVKLHADVVTKVKVWVVKK